MKKTVAIVFISLFVLSCVSRPISNSGSIDKVVQNWAAGLADRDIEVLMDTYWPEAVFTFIPPEGDHMVLRGSDEIRAGQEGGFIDRPKIDIRIDTAKIENDGSTASYILLVEFPDITLINILKLEQRAQEWRIINQIVKFQ